MSIERAHFAHVGHRYQLGDRQVLAIQSGHVVLVREIDEAEPYPLGKTITVKASWLRPLPMRYLSGAVPE